MSPLITKNELSFIFLPAFLMAPPVPRGLLSVEKVILIPNFLFSNNFHFHYRTLNNYSEYIFF